MNTEPKKSDNDITLEDVKKFLGAIITASIIVITVGLCYQNLEEVYALMPGFDAYAKKMVFIGLVTLIGSLCLRNIHHIGKYLYLLLKHTGKASWQLIKRLFKSLYSLLLTLFHKRKSKLDIEPLETEEPKSLEFVSKLPPLSLLEDQPSKNTGNDVEKLKNYLAQALQEYELDFLTIKKGQQGPTVTRFLLSMTSEGRFKKITQVQDELAMYLGQESISIKKSPEGVIMEIPNLHRQEVPHKQIMDLFMAKKSNNLLEVPIGLTSVGDLLTIELDQLPHLLIAGQTGGGKSVQLSIIINSLLLEATPEEVQFLMIDPKVVELSIYNGIPHLLTPVVTDPKKAKEMLEWAVEEMEDRYKKFAASGYRDIDSYNSHSKEKMSKIVAIIDELADLLMMSESPKEIEQLICRLGQKARAAGIHLILATQRPDKDVITGLIKANIPGRIAFSVSSNINSRIILDEVGAEKLLGKGDGLLSTTAMKNPRRFQCSYISDSDIRNIIEWWKNPDTNKVKDINSFSPPPILQQLNSISTATVGDGKLQLVLDELKNEIINLVEGNDSTEIYLPSLTELAKTLHSRKVLVTEQDINTVAAARKALLQEGGWIKKITSDSSQSVKYRIILEHE